MPPAFPRTQPPTPPPTQNPPAAAQREERRRKMVKFLKPGKAVILLQGKYAGKKAVFVRVFEEGTHDRPYGHCLVAVLAKYPEKVICKESAKKTAKKSRVKVFLKLVNFTHLMPTRYTLDVDLKEVVSGAPDSLTTKDKKLTAAKSAKAKLEERFKTDKNRWFFTKLLMIRHDSRNANKIYSSHDST
ncbi:60S ribosomal protein L27-3 [Hordeum vulgare]|nr:60S ribosomal protein L27-3 [Hordeum vulgare]